MSDKIVQLSEQVIKTEIKELVRQSVQEALNSLLDAEADRLTNAKKYERTEGRQDARAGHYTRKLLTGAGEVELEIPKLRTLTFETVIWSGNSLLDTSAFYFFILQWTQIV